MARSTISICNRVRNCMGYEWEYEYNTIYLGVEKTIERIKVLFYVFSSFIAKNLIILCIQGVKIMGVYNLKYMDIL